MEPIFVRKLNRKERDFFYDLIEDKKIGYRAKIIILSYEGYSTSNRKSNKLCMLKCTHRFNEKGIEGILTKKKPGRKPRNNFKRSKL